MQKGCTAPAARERATPEGRYVAPEGPRADSRAGGPSGTRKGHPWPQHTLGGKSSSKGQAATRNTQVGGQTGTISFIDRDLGPLSPTQKVCENSTSSTSNSSSASLLSVDTGIWGTPRPRAQGKSCCPSSCTIYKFIDHRKRGFVEWTIHCAL